MRSLLGVFLPSNHPFAPRTPATVLARLLSTQKIIAVALVLVLLDNRANEDFLFQLFLDAAADAHNLLRGVAAAFPVPPLGFRFRHLGFESGELVRITFNLLVDFSRGKAVASATTLDAFVAFAQSGSEDPTARVTRAPHPPSHVSCIGCAQRLPAWLADPDARFARAWRPRKYRSTSYTVLINFTSHVLAVLT